MKVWHGIVLVVAAGGLAAGLTYWLMASQHAATEESSARSQPAAAPLIVTSRPVERPFVQQVPWIGIVQSQASVQLTALVAGRVEAIEAGDQMPIEAKAVVMRLGGPQVESQRVQIQANVDSLKSQLALAEQTAGRLAQDVEDQLATKNQLAAAQEAQLKLSGQLQDAQLLLKSFEERLVIAAPLTGMFTSRRVSVGQTVEAGQVVAEVVDPNHLRIVASLFVPDGATLKGAEAAVHLSQGRTIPGMVQQVLPQMSDTGATQIWIESHQIDRQFKPGQTVSGMVTFQTTPSALAVPASAVVYDSHERPYVFVEENGTYQQRSITLGLTRDSWVQVLSGLKPGQSVVTQGAYELYYHHFSRQFKVED